MTADPHLPRSVMVPEDCSRVEFVLGEIESAAADLYEPLSLERRRKICGNLIDAAAVLRGICARSGN